jgi:hypothetical protein
LKFSHHLPAVFSSGTPCVDPLLMLGHDLSEARRRQLAPAENLVLAEFLRVLGTVLFQPSIAIVQPDNLLKPRVDDCSSIPRRSTGRVPQFSQLDRGSTLEL